MSISNGSWTYTLETTVLTATSTAQTTDSWNLTGTTGKRFIITPSESGTLVVYANSTIDTYGYLGLVDSTSISSNGAPASYVVSNDDNGDDYGGSPGTAFGITYPVTAGISYYLWVRSYSAGITATATTVTYKIAEPPTLENIYLKVDDSTWVKI